MIRNTSYMYGASIYPAPLASRKRTVIKFHDDDSGQLSFVITSAGNVTVLGSVTTETIHSVCERFLLANGMQSHCIQNIRLVSVSGVLSLNFSISLDSLCDELSEDPIDDSEWSAPDWRRQHWVTIRQSRVTIHICQKSQEGTGYLPFAQMQIVSAPSVAVMDAVVSRVHQYLLAKMITIQRRGASTMVRTRDGFYLLVRQI